MFNFLKYQEIQDFIRKKEKIAKIVAISKNHPKESIIEALKYGVRIFGENKVQEAKKKFAELFKQYPNLELHFTGSLQTNKVKSALQIFQVFQTLDRERLANEFLKFPNLTKDKKFFIQVNTGKEPNKYGVMPNETKDNEKKISLSSNLKNAFGSEIIKSKKISTNDSLINALLSQY